jgi:ABC-type branched-subunit amino acid transport system substrate-binding protein
VLLVPQPDHDPTARLQVDRRAFIRSLLAAGGALLLPDVVGAQKPELLRIGMALPAGGGARVESAARGVQLGVEEAARTGQLMGRAVELRRVGGAPTAAALKAAGVAAVVGGFDAAGCRRLAQAAEGAGVVTMNVGCDANALRTAACGRRLFHVQASAAMYAAALAQGRGRAPGAVRAVLWNPTLDRFGASQLNDRFRARFHLPMDGPAWAGWAAVKILWESSLRARTARPAALAAHLEEERTEFDGHKGWPLSFRPGDHQLRQPLYLEDAKGVLRGEVPVRAGGGGPSLRDLLDRIAGPEPPADCRPEPARNA